MPKEKQFDRAAVLTQAMELFWKQCFEATSMQDLVDATGINRASMYATFGDKHAFFLAAVDHYIATVSSRRLERLQQTGSPRSALADFFDDLIAFSCGDGRRLGCLLTNAAVEMAPRNADIDERLNITFLRLEDAFYDNLLRAQQAGEVANGRDLRAAARLLTGTVQGIRVLARADSDDGTLRDIASEALKAVA